MGGSPAGHHGPENRERSPRNAEYNDPPTAAAVALGDGLRGPNDALTGTKFHFDFVPQRGGSVREVSVIHSDEKYASDRMMKPADCHRGYDNGRILILPSDGKINSQA